MGKTGETKKKIIDLLRQKNLTLTDISGKLDLAPSTVAQHLREMENKGAIKLVTSSSIKYYEVNEGYDNPAMMRRAGERMANNDTSNRVKAGIAFGIIALLAVAGVFYYSTLGGGYANAQQVYIAPGSNAPSGSTVFSISDAPSYYNLTSLVVGIKNVSVHSRTTGKWYDVPLQATSFDLIKLDNISTILSGTKLSNGTYDQIVMHISSISATAANGSSVNVMLPNDTLRIFDRFVVSNNGSASWINMDFNLADSLHIAQNGSIFMVPVIRVTHRYVGSIGINQSSIIVYGHVQHEDSHEFGMDKNGTMASNYTMPQDDWAMSINRDGRAMVINGSIGMPMEGRMGRGFIIRANESTDRAEVSDGGANTTVKETAGIANESEWYNSTYPGKRGGGWSANVTAIFNDGRTFRSHCAYDGGKVSCTNYTDANVSIK